MAKTVFQMLPFDEPDERGFWNFDGLCIAPISLLIGLGNVLTSLQQFSVDDMFSFPSAASRVSFMIAS